MQPIDIGTCVGTHISMPIGWWLRVAKTLKAEWPQSPGSAYLVTVIANMVVDNTLKDGKR